MSSFEKSKTDVLEETIDFGKSYLNDLFKELDIKSQSQILKMQKKEDQIELLKDINHPELQTYYNNLPKSTQEKLDAQNIRDKFRIIKQIVNKKKLASSQKKEERKEIEPEDEEPEKPEKEENDEEEEETEEVIQKIKKEGPQQIRFENMMNSFYAMKPYSYSTINHELEVKFGTKHIRPLMRNDYDNVIKKIKSSGFIIKGNNSGDYYLRINCEFLDSGTGRIKLSDVRTEIKGLYNIEEYCKNNDIKSLYANNVTCIDFIHKKMGNINREKIYPVDFDDFNFRVSYQTEEKTKHGIKNFIIDNWKKSKKEFRFINRVSFQHEDYPFVIDVSIVKFGNRTTDKYGRENRGQTIRVYNLNESNIFNNTEVFEIEIEIDNTKIGPNTQFNSPLLILESLRKVIKLILSGLQGTNYPVSYSEQQYVLDSYMKLIWGSDYDVKKHITSKNFIGPNSITLQLINIAPFDTNSNQPNIRTDFIVTDKADGIRHLLYISKEGKIFLINTNMDIIFTGAITTNLECFNTLLDGELILHDKHGKFINLYAAFDVYYIKNKDVRTFSFLLLQEEKDITKSRYQILQFINKNLNPVCITDNRKKEEQSITSIVKRNKKLNEFISPIRIVSKDFYPNNNNQTIFEACNLILEKEREGRFEYNTDGLIFSHSLFGVGSNEIGKSGPKTKITWEYSFKWKPPQYNTIDFLITTVKNSNGIDTIHSLFQDGMNNAETTQYNQYKTIELRCGFSENKDGFINPCQNIIDDNLPEFIYKTDDKTDDYLPKRFYPTEPYDVNAGLCNILLRSDSIGNPKMFTEENEVFEDNTIVEFRYDLDKDDGWKWIPLRVRYDKTAKLKRGEKEFGNSYKTCNENWKSIHPTGRITENMLSTGLNIPTISVSEDKYYNTTVGKFKTEAMKNFHNLYIKKILITGISKPGDTFIDFACGKAGDLPKWINAKLSFVFGIDLSKDNLENRIDGACSRFLKLKKTNRHVPDVLFVNGNSSFNIKDGSAMLNEKAKQITNAIFGKGTKDPELLGKGVIRQYDKGIEGFNISSCQFAIHYFFENPDTLTNFIKNVAECTKLNGYFIGTCYDGNLVFNKLKQIHQGESIQLFDNKKKIWEIVKGYDNETFNDDSSSIGYRIDVYQESINQLITEYLVNFNYLNRVMLNFGFEIIHQDEARSFGLPEGSGLFSEMFSFMMDDISKNKIKAKDYGKAPYMTHNEKQISFLNRYFVYKKIINVNTDTVKIDIEEYAIQLPLVPIAVEEEVAAPKIKVKKPTIKKLNKFILISDEEPSEVAQQKETPVVVAQQKEEKISKTEKAKAEKAEKAQEKAQEKALKAQQKEQEKALKEQEKSLKAQQKEQEKAEKVEKAEKAKTEKAEKAQEKAQEKTAKTAKAEKAEKAELKAQEKVKEKTEKAELKEQEKALKAEQKEQEKALKAQQKEQEKAEKAEQKAQEKALKAQEKKKK